MSGLYGIISASLRRIIARELLGKRDGGGGRGERDFEMKTER